VMLGAFRDFFKKLYNTLKVYWFHNYFGLFTLLLVLFHVFTKSFIWSNFWNIFLLNSSLAVNLGTIAFYVISLTVITSDLKYFFKINYDYKVWRLIHALNYILFPVIYFHALNLGTVFGSAINYYLLTALLIIALISIIYRALKSANIIGKKS
jgi:predicted ferric reductase